MATKLKDLKITSADLVTQGANPDAHIRLFKRKDAQGDDAPVSDTLIQKLAAAIAGVFGKMNVDGTVEDVSKDAKTFGEEMNRERLRELTSEMFNFCYALSDSLCSIICDSELGEDAKRSLMTTSLDEFTETMKNAVQNWAAGKDASSDGSEAVEKSKAQQAAFDTLWGKITKSMGGESEPGEILKSNQKEEIDTMKIDKSKMTAEEQAMLDGFEKKYGVAEPEGTPAAATSDVAKSADGASPAAPQMHPEVKKALDEAAEVRKAQDAKIEELTKNLEVAGLTAVAKKYEVIGKKSEELAPKLYELKKAGGTAYDDYVALLDEQVTLVEKSGMFTEIGRNTSGSPGVGNEIGIKAAEIAKANNGVTDAAAIAKAFEDNPELAAQYEREYMTGRAN